ncbi:LPXTG cell wall anchor domain-containing protein [Streptococcus lactarius]|uniref:LPXTG cell wall anchor domain-containing protein n=1 Tax=Streptococcus lactarius TaxID=684066 RepID=UPI00360646A4
MDHDNHVVTPKGALLVHLPIKGQLKAVYAMNLDQTLTEQNVKVVGDSLEFTSKDLGLYVIVYQASSPEMVSTNQTLPESWEQGEKEVKTNPASLPKTGDTRSTALFLESLGLLFAAYLLLKKGKEDKTS